MRFKTIEEYNAEIYDIDKKLNKYENYVENHPEKIGVQGNYKLLKHIKDELIKERNQFLPFIQREELNIHLNGDIIKNHSVPSTVLIPIMQKVIDLNYSLVRSIKEGPDVVGKFSKEFKDDFCLNVKAFEAGSFNIIFEPSVFSDKQVIFKDTFNKKAFNLFFEMLKCGDDLDRLNEIHDSIGTYSIVKYRELLNIIYSEELDILFEEKGSTKSKFRLY